MTQSAFDVVALAITCGAFVVAIGFSVVAAVVGIFDLDIV